MDNKKILTLISKHRERIKEVALAAYLDMEDCAIGTRADILIYPDGHIEATGPMTQNTQTMEAWKGEAFVILSIPAWAVGQDGFDYNFDENILYQDNYKELYRRFLQNEDYDDFYSFILDNYYEVIEKMDMDMRESLIDEVFPEEIFDAINIAINYLQEHD